MHNYTYIHYFSTIGIKCTLEKLDPSKSAGPDNIPSRIVKLSAAEVAQGKYKTYNLCKKGDRSVPACDQPLYALAKRISGTGQPLMERNVSSSCLGGCTLRWQPLRSLETFWIVVGGQRHLFKLELLYTSGTADSFLKASYLTRTS